MNRKCITLFALFNGTPNASIITCVRALFHSLRVRVFFSLTFRSFVRSSVCIFFSLLFLSCMFILSFENYTVESIFGSIYENEYAHRKLCRGGNFYLKQKFYIRVSHFAVAGFLFIPLFSDYFRMCFFVVVRLHVSYMGEYLCIGCSFLWTRYVHIPSVFQCACIVLTFCIFSIYC